MESFHIRESPIFVLYFAIIIIQTGKAYIEKNFFIGPSRNDSLHSASIAGEEISS
jgi:hypothetical protein